MAKTKTATKSSVPSSKKVTGKKIVDKKAAAARAERLQRLEAEGRRGQRGRMIALTVSLFLNLTFLVTIYAIWCNYNK